MQLREGSDVRSEGGAVRVAEIAQRVCGGETQCGVAQCGRDVDIRRGAGGVGRCGEPRRVPWKRWEGRTDERVRSAPDAVVARGEQFPKDVTAEYAGKVHVRLDRELEEERAERGRDKERWKVRLGDVERQRLVVGKMN